MSVRLHRGDIILYKIASDDPWIKVVIIGKAVKKGSRYGNQWYNVTNIRTAEDLSVNLDAVATWKKVNEDLIFSRNQLNQLQVLRNEWMKVGSPIAFAGISKIFECFLYGSQC